MANITSADMRGQLLSLDDVRERLASTEPLNEHVFPVASSFDMELGENWATPDDLDTPTSAYMTAPGGDRYQLTKQSVLEAGAACGIPRKYQERCPSNLLTAQINYWFQTGFGDKEFKLLAQDRETPEGVVTPALPLVMAMCRGTVQPFSNLRLLDSALEGIQAKYGEGEILADYKFAHSLERTHLRLIIPEHTRLITGTAQENDNWSIGLQVKNSQIGLKQTELSGYLFRWWCTNGSIDTLASTGGFSRRGHHTEEEAYDWARDSVDSVLGGLEQTLDNVQALTEIPISGDATLVLRDLFGQYNIPVRERERVIANMADAEGNSMYDIMQAITRTANADELPANAVEQLMAMGGHTAHAAAGRCDSCRRLLPEGWEVMVPDAHQH